MAINGKTTLWQAIKDGLLPSIGANIVVHRPEIVTITGWVDLWPNTTHLGTWKTFDPTISEADQIEKAKRSFFHRTTCRDMVIRPEVDGGEWYYHFSFADDLQAEMRLRRGDHVVIQAEARRPRMVPASKRPPWVRDGRIMPVPILPPDYMNLTKEEHFYLGEGRVIDQVNGHPLIWTAERPELWPFRGGVNPPGPLPCKGEVSRILRLLNARVCPGDHTHVVGTAGCGKTWFILEMFRELPLNLYVFIILEAEYEQDIEMFQLEARQRAAARADALKKGIVKGGGDFIFAASNNETAAVGLGTLETALHAAMRAAEAGLPTVVLLDSMFGVVKNINTLPVPEGLGIASRGQNPLGHRAVGVICGVSRYLSSGASLTMIDVCTYASPDDENWIRLARANERGAITLDGSSAAARYYPALDAGVAVWGDAYNQKTYSRSPQEGFDAQLAQQLVLYFDRWNQANAPRQRNQARPPSEALLRFLRVVRSTPDTPAGDLEVARQLGLRKPETPTVDLSTVEGVAQKLAELGMALYSDIGLPKTGLAEKLATIGTIDGVPITRGIARRAAEMLRKWEEPQQIARQAKVTAPAQSRPTPTAVAQTPAAKKPAVTPRERQQAEAWTRAVHEVTNHAAGNTAAPQGG